MVEFFFDASALVSGERVRQARELAALTQAQLAKRVGVSQSMLAHVESGFKPASEEILREIARCTGVPTNFFRLPPPPEPPLGTLLFRKKSAVRRGDITLAYREAQLVLGVALHLLERVRRPVKVVSLQGTPPASAAKHFRHILKIDADVPIPHLIRSFEKVGGVVLVIKNVPGLDAFAFWYEEQPVLAISNALSGDRVRLTAAHEIAHLLLHGGLPPSRTLEDEAYQFAAELLMPAQAIRADFSRGVGLESVARLKLRWGVSIQALIRRARDLQFITDRQYHYLFQQLSARGWRTQEPKNLYIPTERPRLLRKIAEMVYGSPIDYAAAAKELRLKTEAVMAILNRYADASQVAQAPSTSTARVVDFERA